MLDDLLLRSLLAGILMVAVAAPMGCLMVWQRLSFLADTLGHASILGVALGLMLAVDTLWGVLGVIVLLIVLIRYYMGDQGHTMSESLLAIIAYTGLAGGVILLGMTGSANISLQALLFGDLLATSTTDLLFISIITVVLAVLLWQYWHDWVAISINSEIARAEGIPTARLQSLFYLMVALLIAVMMKIMGVLLIGAMLVIPVNAARLVGKSPEQMLFFSWMFGVLSLLSGFIWSWHIDVQTGPAIVVLASAWLILTFTVKKLFQALTLRL